MITSMCFMCFQYAAANLLQCTRPPNLWNESSKLVGDFVEKTKGLVSRFTTSRMRIPGI